MAKKDTPQKILAAAFKCISEKGCAGVNLREIADEAGVVLSQLNYYFVNKEKLFSAVLHNIQQDYIAHVDAQMALCAGEAEKIDFLIEYNRHLLQTHQALYRSFLDFFNLALWSDSFRHEMSQFLNKITEVIERGLGKEGSTLNGNSASTLTHLILGASFGLAMQHLMKPEDESILQGFDILRTLARTPSHLPGK